MNELIVRLRQDTIRVKGGEYVQDLVRCKACMLGEETLVEGDVYCRELDRVMRENNFCSYGERR